MSSKGLSDTEIHLIEDNYGRIAHYFEKSKCLNINVDAEYEVECTFAITLFENEEIRKLSSKIRNITLWIECGSFMEVNLWNKMQHIVELLDASKDIIDDLDIFLTHESDVDNDLNQRQYLFEQFMKRIIDASAHKLRYINFNIEGIEPDLYPIYISYLIQLLLPNTSEMNHIHGLQITIFGDKMLNAFCKLLSNAVIDTSTLKSLSVTFDNISINHKLNTFLQSVSLNNYISCLSFHINDRGSFKKEKEYDMSIVTMFYMTLYTIFTNKWEHLKTFGLEYNISRRECEYNHNNHVALCKLDDALLMKKYVLEPIMDCAQHLTEFEWKVDMRWNDINLDALSMLFVPNHHDFECIHISKIRSSDTMAMIQCLKALRHSNCCKELKLNGLNGKLFTELLCDFIAEHCGATFETLRFRMKYSMDDVCLLDKHSMMILSCFTVHLEYLYRLYQVIIPSILNDFGLPSYLNDIIIDYSKMRCFKLDFSLLMSTLNRKIKQPLHQRNLENRMSVELNGLIDRLKLNKRSHGAIVIKRDCQNDHPLLKQLFAAFIKTSNVSLHFTAIDCKLLFSINP